MIGSLAFAVLFKMPHWTAILAIVALVQWLVFAVLSMISAEEPPKFGMRGAERNLLFSTAAVALVWLVSFDAKAVVFGSATPAQASAASSPESGSAGNATCAAVAVGMSGSEVKSKLGTPKVLNEEDTRGPGAKLWFFKQSRCAVHMLDDTVEFID